MHQVECYSEERKSRWDDFVQNSKNGTFLFLRDYMEYHRNRFEDYSLVITDEDRNLVALLPANRQGPSLFSHGGLTYGGFVTTEAMKLPTMLAVFEATLQYLQGNGFSRLIYKTIPFLYHHVPAEEDLYALFLCRARLVRRGVMAVTRCQRRPLFQGRRTRGARKATQNGVTVRETREFPEYWQLLSERLRQTYNSNPVHSLSEIEMLQSRFPQNIRLFAAFEARRMIAGVLIHESDRVARAQYIAANHRGQELGALDLIFTQLLMNEYAAKSYFDFGTSDEQDGSHVNKGLIDQKEGYGARVVGHDHYELQLADWTSGQLLQALQ